MNFERIRVATTLFWRQLRPTLSDPRQFIGLMRRLFDMLKKRGLLGALKHHAPSDNLYIDYPQWLESFYTPAAPATGDASITVLSVIVLHTQHVPNAAPGDRKLQDLAASLLAQSSPCWELLIASPAAPSSLPSDTRIRSIQVPAQTAAAQQLNLLLATASGKFVLHAQDLRLHAHAVGWIAHALQPSGRSQAPRFVYWDQDQIAEDGTRHDPDFKPDWNPAMLCSRNYPDGSFAVERAHLRAVGGYSGVDINSRCWDLALRATGPLGNPGIETATSVIHGAQIVHIALILTHHFASAGNVQANALAADQGVNMVARHIARKKSSAIVTAVGDRVRVQYELPSRVPPVSIIIPTRDGLALLRQAVDSIKARTDYADYEIIIVDNQSRQAETKTYLRSLESAGIAKIIPFDAAFNYSAINNAAARKASGELLCLLNNDIEVISPHWLSELVGHALQPDTGAVGAMLYFPDDRIQHAGVVLGLGGYAKHVFAHQPRAGLAQRPGPLWRTRATQNYSAVTAACLVVRKSVFDQVNGFDEQFVIEMNDVDLCLRIEQLGYRNLWTPHVELYHHESASRGYDHSAERRSRAEAEAERFAKRWGALLMQDPCYNRNLALDRSPFMLAWPPR